MSKIFVLGSVNMDLVLSAERMPRPGESVVGRDFMMNPGGKGANQAVACAKLGGDCVFLGAVGGDDFGRQLISSLEGYGVNAEAVQIVPDQPSGACVVLLDESRRDNALVVSLGANGCLNAGQAAAYLRGRAKAGDILITQLEVNLDAVSLALAEAKRLGMRTVLNPAPMRRIGAEILSYADLVVPNETEAESLTGVRVRDEASARAAFAALSRFGVRELIVTLGGEGCVHVNGGAVRHYPACRVAAVDPTSAGDTFIGALAVRLLDDPDIASAIPFASACAAVTVRRKGAAASIPTRVEAEEFIRGIGC